MVEDWLALIGNMNGAVRDTRRQAAFLDSARSG